MGVMGGLMDGRPCGWAAICARACVTGRARLEAEQRAAKARQAPRQRAASQVTIRRWPADSAIQSALRGRVARPFTGENRSGPAGRVDVDAVADAVADALDEALAAVEAAASEDEAVAGAG